MYAIIRTGGKQAKVQPGDVVDVELLKHEGEQVDFTPLLVVDDKGKAITGRQALADVKVKAKVLGDVAGDKVEIFKYRPKTGYRRRAGHRQRYTRVEITGIELPKRKAAKKASQESPAEDDKDDKE